MQALADGALATLPAVTGMYQQAGVAAGEHGEARVHGHPEKVAGGGAVQTP